MTPYKWLREGKGEMFQENKSPLEAEVLKMFRELSKTAQLMVRDYIKMVLDQQQVLSGKVPEALQAAEKQEPAPDPEPPEASPEPPEIFEKRETPRTGPRLEDAPVG
jgi:hypothetical protein